MDMLKKGDNKSLKEFSELKKEKQNLQANEK